MPKPSNFEWKSLGLKTIETIAVVKRLLPILLTLQLSYRYSNIALVTIAMYWYSDVFLIGDKSYEEVIPTSSQILSKLELEKFDVDATHTFLYT